MADFPGNKKKGQKMRYPSYLPKKFSRYQVRGGVVRKKVGTKYSITENGNRRRKSSAYRVPNSEWCGCTVSTTFFLEVHESQSYYNNTEIELSNS